MIKRPLCPDCNSSMKFRVFPSNPENVNTQFVCKGCGVILDSNKTVADWNEFLESGIPITDYLRTLKRRSKQDDIPGTTEGEVEKPCPVCGRKMRKYKPCCNSKEGYIGCMPCNWKEPV